MPLLYTKLMKPRLYVDQKITLLVNRYIIYSANTSGDKGESIGFVEQERFKLKEKVNFYTDKTKQQLVFTFRAEKTLDIHGKYLVEDADGTLIGYFEKAFGKSLLRSTWYMCTAAGERVFTVTESSSTLAAIRRFIGYIPVVGEFAELISMLFRYHFVFLQDDQQVGTYRKTTLLRDNYQLSMTDDAYAKLDQRVLAAMSVALDALQSR